MWHKRRNYLRLFSKVWIEKVKTMKVLKHFYKKGKGLIIGLTCKHADPRESSCPFTGITYTVCDRCTKIIGGRKTDA